MLCGVADGCGGHCGLTCEGTVSFTSCDANAISDNTLGPNWGCDETCAGEDGWVNPDFATIDSYSADEVCGDELDNNCDGQVDEGCDASNSGVVNNGDPNNGDGGSSASTSKDDGCAVAAGSGSNRGLWLLMGLALVLMVRRRR